MSQHTPRIRRLLVANRGEIATRIISTARELDILTYAVYTTNDASHTLNAHASIQLSSPAAYLDIAELVSIVKKNDVDAVHPGYGFLSESAEFAKRVNEETGAVVVGPGWDILARTGDKLQARKLAEECNVPVLPALQAPTDDIETFRGFAAQVGYPIIIKAVDGGGGKGVRIVKNEEDLPSLAKRALAESPSKKAFAEAAAIDGYRHVEIQIVGDRQGNITHLWERECSIQRRFQKVVEFAPSSIKDRDLVAKVIEAALRMARKVKYQSLGTFEFLVRAHPPAFYFLEINPRLQVEHTVTESIAWGLDLVKMQLLIASGHPLSAIYNPPLGTDPHIPPPTHSLQLRIMAEDASNKWTLSVGKVSSFRFPSGNGIRVDTSMLPSPQTIVGTDFDSLLAKIIITAPTWSDVVSKTQRALADTNIEGITTNVLALRGIVHSDAFIRQECDTQWLELSLPSILDVGSHVSKSIKSPPGQSTAAITASAASSGPTSTLFRKGDAWSISISLDTPRTSSPAETAPLHHLELTKVLRNDFPASISATVLYTAPSQSAVPLRIDLSSTTASASSLASSSLYRRGDPSNANHIIIPFPGKLVEILVEEGDDVKQGDTVAIVRQMKMELEIRSHRAGRIIWVFEGEDGEDVGQGVLVAELDAGGGAKL